jgi:Family of unknown function (DUF6262)
MTSQRIRQVEEACSQLAVLGETVTFVAVARHTGIARGTLYRNSALRAVVDEHHDRARHATTLTGLAAQLGIQQLTLHALADRVRQHEEVIRKLSQPR